MGLAASPVIMRRVAQATLGILAASCFICFGFITFARVVPWYNDAAFAAMRDTMTLKFPGDVEVATTLLLQCGSVLIAALCASGLVQLRRTAAVDSTNTSHQRQHGLMANIVRKLRLLAFYRLPPYGFWEWACGGVTCMDVLLVATWLGLAVLNLYTTIDNSFTRIGVNYGTSPPPSPPAKGFNATLVTAAVACPISAPFLVQRLDSTGKLFGSALRPLVMLMFFPVSRSSFFKWLLGTDFISLVRYHRWMSVGVIVISFIHGSIYMVEWGAAGDITTNFAWDTNKHKVNVVGLLAMIVALVMGFTSTAWFRAHYYWLFSRLHIAGFLVFTICLLMHYKAVVYWILPGLLMYGADRAFRFFQLMNCTRISGKDSLVNANVISLNLKWNKDCCVEPGQTVYLRCPHISWTQSHPFSVADVVKDEAAGGAQVITVHIRAGGAWTTALKKHLLAGDSLLLQVEGPYDTRLTPLPTAPVIVMVAGGMGITPLLGLLHAYRRAVEQAPHISVSCNNSENNSSDDAPCPAPCPTVYLSWTSRSLAELSLFGSDLLSTMVPLSHMGWLPSGHSGSAGSWLRGALHYTGLEQELKIQRQEEMQQGKLALCAVEPTHHAVHTADALPNSDTAGVDQPVKFLNTHPTACAATYAVCMVLSIFGAWAGLLTYSYYDAYYARIGKAAVQLFAIMAGCLLPPFAFLVLLQAIKRRCAQASPLQDEESQQHKASSSRNMHIDSSRQVSILPGYWMCPAAGKVAGGGSGVKQESLKLLRGRPDVAGLLARVRASHPEAPEVLVLVAGPQAMWVSVVASCAEANQGVPGPVLFAWQVAHAQ
ncbi:hypothetical protein QJQ45_017303 [Haematococcus lacustris]|nr:hypothetical protein QJQ45_017303 [Haematococcus lacustris]